MTDEEIEKLIERADAVKAYDIDADLLHIETAETSCADVSREGFQAFAGELASALRQLMQERQWRPISEAPKDGTIVDLWHAKYGRLTDIWWDDGWVTAAEDEHITHFMPLPQPPSSFEEPKATRTDQPAEEEA